MDSRREILQNQQQLAVLAKKIDVSKRLPHSQRYSPLSFSHATSPVNRQAVHDNMNNFLSQSVANSAMNSIQNLQHNIPINHKAKLAVIHKKSNTLFYEGNVPKTMVNVAKNRNFVLYHQRNQNDCIQNDDFKNVMSKYHRQQINKSQIVGEEKQLFSQPLQKEIVEIEKGRDTAILLKPQVIKQKKVIAMNEKKHLKGLKLYKDSIDKRGRQVQKEFRSALYSSQDNSLGKGSLGSHTARFYDNKEQDSIENQIDNPAYFMNGGKRISIESRESSLNRILASGDHLESKHFDTQAQSTVKTMVTQKGIYKGHQDIYDSLNGKDTIDQGNFISCLTGAISYFNQKKVCLNQTIENKGMKRRIENEKIINENIQLRQQTTRASQYQTQMNQVLQQKDQMIEDQEQMIYQMRQQLEDMQISLKESEIRLAHTTELFTREKIEKESTAIAFKRIINKMTMDPNEQRKKQIRTQSTTAMSPGRDIILDGNYEEYSYYGKAMRLEDQLNDREMELSKLKTHLARGVVNSTESIDKDLISMTQASMYDDETYNFNPYHMEEQQSPSCSDSSLRNLYSQPYPTPFSEAQIIDNQTNCQNNSVLFQHLKQRHNNKQYFQCGSTRADTLQNNSGFRKQEEFIPKLGFVSPSRDENSRCVPESLIKKQTNEQRYW